MAGPFNSFVLFAEMRTGSNFLEANLNALNGVKSYGEAFNPHFVGYPKDDVLMGVSLKQREANPDKLLKKIFAADGVTGFRYFHDHDPRVLDAVLDDPSCAKIILRRDPLDSFVSWKIAQSTGQWKLTNIARRREARARFDQVEFAGYLGDLQEFQVLLKTRLQHSGQTAFYLDYTDLKSVEVVNGLAAYLGVSDRLEKLDQSLKVQNPAPLADKVTNPEEMSGVLDRFFGVDTKEAADLEPSRMAAVTTYVTAARAPLVYLPIRGGPDRTVIEWLASLDEVASDLLPTGLTQKDLRQWKRASPGHRSFTVIRHPAARAHHAYCSFVLGHGPVSYTAIRQNLARRTGGVIPFEKPTADYTVDAHRAGFIAFLEFLAENLNGQTAIRVDAAWCSQAKVISGFARFAAPDLIVRESEMASVLPDLASGLGYRQGTMPASSEYDTPFELAEIYDAEIEGLARRVYQRDYIMFGFSDWR